MIESLFTFGLNQRRLVAMLVILITLPLGYGVTKLEIDTSFFCYEINKLLAVSSLTDCASCYSSDLSAVLFGFMRKTLERFDTPFHRLGRQFFHVASALTKAYRLLHP